MIVGGANQPFETTFRVLAFSQGSIGPLQMIPLCGGLISVVWASSATALVWRALMKLTLGAPFWQFSFRNSLLRRRIIHRVHVYGRVSGLRRTISSHPMRFSVRGLFRANLTTS